MTDITDQDRRTAIDVAEAIERGDYPMAAMWPIMARVILATVDAPEPTLAEELRDVADNYGMSSRAADRLHDIADRMEHDLAEARAQAERLTAVNENLRRTDNYREFRDKFLTVQKGAESNAESLDPADVKPGEAWLVEVEGGRRNAVKDNRDTMPWCTFNAGGLFFPEENEDITLLHRLVPAPRVITNPDELDRAKRCTVIRDAAGVICERDPMGDDWSTFASLVNQKAYIILPATVLWEPGA